MKQLWWILWGVVFAAFVTFDALELAGLRIVWLMQFSAILKFLSIVSCLGYVLLYRRQNSLLVIAMSLTLLADAVLFWTGQTELGVLVFCFAQIFHSFRFAKVKPIFLLGYGMALAAVFAYLVSRGISAIYALSFIYASELLLNIILSWRFKWLTPTGFLCFVACDINVGLSFLTGWSVTSFLVFVFYLPSQVFLAKGRDRFSPSSAAKSRQLLPKISPDHPLPNAA